MIYSLTIVLMRPFNQHTTNTCIFWLYYSEGVRQLLEKLRWQTRHNAAVLIQCTWRSWRTRRKWAGTKRVMMQMQQVSNPIVQCT